jgi:ribosomal protein S18 acetylase RimI-like enzyme
MIRYTSDLAGISADHLQGFFEGWINPPSPETHLALLAHSDYVVLARDEENGNVVGFVTAIGDGILSAYIPFLEVLSSYRGQGIGRELMRRMLERLGDFYMVDLLCDPELQPFYARLGMSPAAGMLLRNYDRQSGRGH